MAFRLRFFENNQLNLAVYFLITSIILYFGPERFLPSLLQGNPPTVDAPCGQIIGSRSVTRYGREIAAFRGIPYAKPPVGKLRFKRTEPLLEITNDGSPFHATSFGRRCFQPSGLYYPPYVGQEDCLTLNVFVPNTDQAEGGIAKTKDESNETEDKVHFKDYDKDVKDLLPVMVFVHGGGFTTGESNLYGPSYLLDRNVILVTLNYRLGPLGFLNLGGDEIKQNKYNDFPTGNQALWDQREAFKWVQRNIQSFGGDPKKVTIFGESAGGMSISYHLVSMASRGLFQRAIVQSGTLHSSFLGLSIHRPIHEYHKEFLLKLGCNVGNEEKERDPARNVMTCLQSKPLKDIYANTFMFDECNILSHGFGGSDLMPFPTPWQGSADFSYTSKPFFSDEPKTLMERGDVPRNVEIMIGSNKDDGMLQSTTLYHNTEKFENFKKNWEKCGPSNLFSIEKRKNSEKWIRMANDVKSFYIGEEDMDIEKHFNNITDMLSDAMFSYGTDYTVRKLKETTDNPIYYYIFAHSGGFSLGDVFGLPTKQLLWKMVKRLFGYSSSTDFGMVSHADELLYLFKVGLIPFDVLPNEIDKQTSNLMVDMWANFATYGKPIPSPNEMLEGGKKKLGSLVSNDTLLKPPRRIWKSVENKSDGGANYIKIVNDLIVFFNDPQYDKRMQFWKKLLG